jgi:Cytochrome C oxidase, cbb3-type, subunit III
MAKYPAVTAIPRAVISMSLPRNKTNKTLRNLLIAACGLGALLPYRAQAATDLNICVDPAGPTSAMDARVASAVAKTQGYVVKLGPFDATSAYASTGFISAGRLINVADTSGKIKPKYGTVPALYTVDQAAQGARAYFQNCVMCHGPLLDGQAGGYSGPALKGPEFADPNYDFHVSDIFNFVAKLMPPGTPGSLTQDQDVQIMAFILQQNGFPPGRNELVYAEAAKSMVPLRYYGK